MQHQQPHPLAGLHAMAKVSTVPFAGERIHVIDWWDRTTGKSWMQSTKHPAAVMYALRSQFKLFPLDDVVQVIVEGGLFLFHDSELEREVVT